MPLVSCPDCGRNVSDQATACPHCGRPQTAGWSTPEPTVNGASPAGRWHGIESAAEPHPWLRNWARTADLILGTVVLAILLAILEPRVLDADAYSLGMLTLAFWVPLEAWFLSTWGYTPGKALLNIRVFDSANGATMAYGTALKRSGLVWMKGVAFGFPMISLITMLFASRRIEKKGRASWDEDAGTVVLHGRLGMGHILSMVAIALVFAFLAVLSSLPS